jgi:hypothetical protein
MGEQGVLPAGPVEAIINKAGVYVSSAVFRDTGGTMLGKIVEE